MAAALGPCPLPPHGPPAGRQPLLVRPRASASVGLGAGVRRLGRRLAAAFSCYVPCPPCSEVRRCTFPVSPSGTSAPQWGGGGGGLLPAVPVTPGATAVPRRLCPLPCCHPPTIAWGLLPPPGLVPSPEGDQGPSPRPGARSWAVGV